MTKDREGADKAAFWSTVDLYRVASTQEERDRWAKLAMLTGGAMDKRKQRQERKTGSDRRKAGSDKVEMKGEN